MTDKAKSELFKIIANKIVGQWYNCNSDDCLVFALSENLNKFAYMQVEANNDRYDASYKLNIHPNNSICIVIQGIQARITAIIKVISADTFIMQLYDKRLMILQRRPDTSFAEKVIERLS